MKEILTRQDFTIGDVDISFTRKKEEYEVSPTLKYNPETGKKNNPKTRSRIAHNLEIKRGKNTITLTEGEIESLKKILNNTTYIFEQDSYVTDLYSKLTSSLNEAILRRN